MEYVYKRKGSVCVFTGCSANKRDNPDRVFFRFPVKRADICKQWILNCANEELSDLSDSQLINKFVCDKHFKRSCFTSDMRNRLEVDAVPTLLNVSLDMPTASPPTTSAAVATSSAAVATSSSAVATSCSAVATSSAAFATSSAAVATPSAALATSSAAVATSSTTVATSSTEDVPHLPPVTWTICANAPKAGTSGTSTILSASPGISSTLLNKKDVTVKPITPSKRKSMKNEDTPRKKKLRKSIQKYRTSTRKLSMKIKRLGTKTKKLAKHEIFKAASNSIKNDSFNTLLKMQLLHKKSTQWQEDEKQLAIEMFYRSPSLYNNLRDVKKFNLPARQTISQWLNVSNLMPGLSEELIQMLKFKVKNMTPEEKQVVLIFDEMAIKLSLNYNEKRDIVEGFQDLGSLGRSAELASHSLMFLVRGLLTKWKIPVAYFLASNNVKGSDISKIIVECASAMQDIGLKVRVIVCDQGSNNRKAMAGLGVSMERPYFEIDGARIYTIFDIPHLLKCVRNSLMKRPIQFDGGFADWQHIVQIFQLDVTAGKARALCKLTNKHIWPNSFDKMKVKLASQVFSNTVKAVLITAVETKQLPEEALHTATFVGKLNDLFDCLNSKVPFDPNPLRCAISSYPAGLNILNHLQGAVPWINSWKSQVLTRREKERPPSFDGFVWTITGINMLWNDLKIEGCKFLLTNRLTQDALENEFSIARQRCGYERNPSAMQFRQNLRYRVHVILMKPPETANCEMDEDPMVAGDESGSEIRDDQSNTEGEDEDIDDPAEVPILHTDPDDDDSEDDIMMDVDAVPSTTDESPVHESPAPSLQPALPSQSLETCAVQ